MKKSCLFYFKNQPLWLPIYPKYKRKKEQLQKRLGTLCSIKFIKNIEYADLSCKIDKKCFTCRVKHILSTVYAEISHSLHMVNGNGNMRQLPNNLWKLWITSQLYLYRIIADC